jgi:site-specific DNA-cytosine methylase|tara:strand:- start:282 stop:866 length:585 start_codon:yes stop_codon:yes gene_type:complete
MNVLELFSGTGSIGKVCEKLGWNPISLDLDNRADIVCDIMDFDYKQYPKDYFGMIWASPPCDEYSCMNNCRPEKIPDLDSADKLVLKTLEIIEYFKPEVWFIENPQTGKLKDRPFMKELSFYDVDYCMYGWYARKRTRIWTNKKDWNNLKCDKTCGKIIDNKHKSVAYLNIPGMNRLDLRHAIPEDLIFSLFLE